MVSSEELPPALTDDSIRPTDVVSMQFSTPASITIRRPSRSPGADRVEKKECLEYPTLVSEGTSDQSECVTRCNSPGVVEIPDLSFVKCPFDLGVSADLRRSNLDVKLAIANYIEHPMLSAKVTDTVIADSIDHVVTTDDISVATGEGLDPVVTADDPLHVSGDVIDSQSDAIDPAVSGLLDDLPDTAFDEFVPSLPDCVLSDSDDGDSGKDDTTDPNSNTRWRSVSAADYEIIRKGGVRKSIRVENWANKAFNEQRTFRGYPTIESIADLSGKPDVTPLVDLLMQYFLELKTQNLVYTLLERYPECCNPLVA